MTALQNYISGQKNQVEEILQKKPSDGYTEGKGKLGKVRPRRQNKEKEHVKR